jgi:putative DNA primase/helicase
MTKLPPELAPEWSQSAREFREDRERKERRAFNGHPPSRKAAPSDLHSTAAHPQQRQSTLLSAPASSFAMHGIRWLWKDRFALGKLGLIGGLPDKGKGLISAYMAGCVTTVNLEWPCGEGKAPQGNVIWFTAEDDIGDTVKPRLVAVGADLDRVHIMQMIKNPNGGERMFNLATDLPALEAKIDQIGDVQLVLIDPVTSYLGVGKLNTSSTTDVRGILGPLVKLAERKRVAIVGIMHFNKKADVTNAMLRIADSLAYVAAARHVYVVVDDAENAHMRLFVKAKNNLAPDKYALRYGVNVKVVGRDEELGVDIVAPFVVWSDHHVEITATQAMEADADRRSGQALRTAVEFLSEQLAEGPVLKTSIEDAAEATGIAPATLRRAQQQLKVKAFKERGTKDGKWLWKLPDPVGG